MPQGEELEYKILKLLSERKDPLGCGTMKILLREHDLNSSEATVGRKLRELEQAGYLHKIGVEGRLITESGLRRYRELETEREFKLSGLGLINALKNKGKKDLLDVLIARRAVEGEIARLACHNATGDEIKHMEKVLKEQKRRCSLGEDTTFQDYDFHESLAKASKNDVLKSVLELLRNEGQIGSIFFSYIRFKVMGRTVEDHRRILNSIKEKRVLKAQRAMHIHLDKLIGDIEKYWDNFVQDKGINTQDN